MININDAKNHIMKKDENGFGINPFIKDVVSTIYDIDKIKSWAANNNLCTQRVNYNNYLMQSDIEYEWGLFEGIEIPSGLSEWTPSSRMAGAVLIAIGFERDLEGTYDVFAYFLSEPTKTKTYTLDEINSLSDIDVQAMALKKYLEQRDVGHYTYRTNEYDNTILYKNGTYWITSIIPLDETYVLKMAKDKGMLISYPLNPTSPVSVSSNDLSIEMVGEDLGVLVSRIYLLD